MTFIALIGVLGLLGVLFLIAAVRSMRRHRVGGGLFQGITSFVLLAIAACLALAAVGLRTYQRLSAEQPVGTLEFRRIGYHQFDGSLIVPGGERRDFALRGDEWQVDARVLKFQVLAELVGFDALYRLDRISGRYTRIEDEHDLPRTVFAVEPPDTIDLWALLHHYNSWLPLIDASYGSATFLPMTDGAAYQITLSPSGLLARPLNEAARDAVGHWK